VVNGECNGHYPKRHIASIIRHIKESAFLVSSQQEETMRYVGSPLCVVTRCFPVICFNGTAIFVNQCVLPVLQVLQQLPEGLAIAVLAASTAGFEKHLFVLQMSLHSLVIEAAFPSIHRHHSLTLDFDSLRDPTTACAVLHVATAETTGASPLQVLDLKHIPLTCGDHLLHLMSAACKSASNVQLDFGYVDPKAQPCSLDLAQFYPMMSNDHPLVQLSEALSHSSALTRLQLTSTSDLWDAVILERLFEPLTGLRSLEFSSSFHIFSNIYLDAPRAIAKLR
jgi:hypothetical protein